MVPMNLPRDAEPFEQRQEEQFACDHVVTCHFYAKTRVYFDRSFFSLSRERAVALAREAYGKEVAVSFGGDFGYYDGWKRSFCLDVPPHLIGCVEDSAKLMEDPCEKLSSFLELMHREAGAEGEHVA